MAVGLVEALGRRRAAVARPGRRAAAEDGVEQPAQVAVLDRRRAARAGRPPSAPAERGGPSRSVGEVEGARLGGAQRAQRELGAVAVGGLQPPADAHRRADRRDRARPPRRRRRRSPAALPVRSPSTRRRYWPPPSARAQLRLADDEHAVDWAPACSSRTNMVDTLASGADGPRRDGCPAHGAQRAHHRRHGRPRRGGDAGVPRRRLARRRAGLRRGRARPRAGARAARARAGRPLRPRLRRGASRRSPPATATRRCARSSTSSAASRWAGGCTRRRSRTSRRSCG